MATEILLGATTYSTAVDMWSVGCIFGELLLKEPLFQAKNEIELVSMIFKLLGPPTDQNWPEFRSLPLTKTINIPFPQPHQFRQRFPYLTATGIDLLMSLLTYDPDRRISAAEALHHPYFRSVTSRPDDTSLTVHFSESPAPKHPDLFSSFPSVAAGEKLVSLTRISSCLIIFSAHRPHKKPFDSPSAPVRAAGYQFLTEFDMQ